MITPDNVAGTLDYLLGARALTVTRGQASVWHDYLTHEIPDIQPEELPDARRRAVREWSANGRAWQVDVARFAAAIRANRRDRVQAAIGSGAIPVPAGLAGEPEVELAWRRAWAHAVSMGLDDAEKRAWAAIDRTPPAGQIGASGMSGRERARQLAAQLADRARA